MITTQHTYGVTLFCYRGATRLTPLVLDRVEAESPQEGLYTAVFFLSLSGTASKPYRSKYITVFAWVVVPSIERWYVCSAPGMEVLYVGK